MVTFKAAGAIFGFGILVLVIGLFVAPMVTASSTNAEQSFATDDTQTQVHQNLNMSVEIDDTGSTNNATYTFTDTTTFANQETVELAPGDNETITLSGEDITITYHRYENDTGMAISTVEYPPTFQYGDTVKVFYENLGLLLSIIGVLFAMSGVVMGVRAA